MNNEPDPPAGPAESASAADAPEEAAPESPSELADSPAEASDDAHPDRYRVREKDGERYLYCIESPEIAVLFDRSAIAQETAARRAPSGTIFVDGAAQAPPFLDAEREVFNLDHHVGCVRQFTIAACEQALVMVLRGLDLGKRPWTIRAAAPDLDAILAIWVLLNAPHIQAAGSTVRRRLIPLVRLESVIDVHGLGFAEICGLGPMEMEAAMEALESLRRHELRLKKDGAWSETDAADHTAEVLRELDHLVFPAGSLPQPVPFEVLARATVGGEGLVLVCRAEEGIYEVESGLKKVYGKRLVILALETEPGRYSLRLVDPFRGGDLEAVYEELNTLDPAVASGGWRNSWGGSGEIGGSPRKSGTVLRPREIAEACRRALSRLSPMRRIAAVAAAGGLAALGLLAGLAATWPASGLAARLPGTAELFPFAVGFGMLAVALLLGFGLWRPRAFGLQPLVPGDWLWVLPVALGASLAGGAWRPPVAAAATTGDRLALVLLLAVGAEALFRGVVHGVLGRRFKVSHAGGRWFLSLPGAISALLYAGAGAILPLAGPPFAAMGAPAEWIVRAAAALLFGLTAALARERSGSVLAPTVLHLVGAALGEALT